MVRVAKRERSFSHNNTRMKAFMNNRRGSLESDKDCCEVIRNESVARQGICLVKIHVWDPALRGIDSTSADRIPMCKANSR
jgi:hypothetical protein